MKKLLSILLALALVLTLCACSKSSDGEESTKAAGFATAEEALLAYCEALFSLDWEGIEETVHPEVMASAYGQAFKSEFFASPEYADRDSIEISGLALRDSEGARDCESFEEWVAYLDLDVEVENMKTHRINFDCDYEGWVTGIFIDEQFVMQIDGRWYALPYHEISAE